MCNPRLEARILRKTVVPTKDFSLEFLVTGTEKSNNRFTLKAKNELYLNGKLCITFGTPFGEPGKTEPEAEEKAPAHSQESTPRDGGAAHGQTISHEFFDGLKLIKESWIGSIVLPSTTHTRCSDYPRFHSPDDMLGGLWAFLDQMNCTWQGTVYSPIAPLAEFAVKRHGPQCFIFNRLMLSNLLGPSNLSNIGGTSITGDCHREYG
jgi:hypothetical protein